MTNTQSKPWYQSKTVIGGAIAAVAGILGLIGFDIGPADQQAMTDTVLALGGAVGGAIAIYGRVVASKKLK